MNSLLARGWRVCVAATVLFALVGCSARVRNGMADGYDHGHATPCGAAFIGFHGPLEQCMDD